MSGGRGESGFTLIEMLVALAIFSLAALALLRLGGATAANSSRLQEQRSPRSSPATSRSRR
jgi:general secretion pathway protein I